MLDAAPPSSSPASPPATALRVGLPLLAAAQIVQGLLLVAAPGRFYRAVADFGPRNDHDLRDMSAFYLASGIVLALAIRRPSWRVPALALVGLQFALHALNHAVDVGGADPGWIGPFDLVSLAAGALLIVALWRLAARDEGGR